MKTSRNAMGQHHIELEQSDYVFVRLPNGSHITISLADNYVSLLVMPKLGQRITHALVSTGSDRLPEAQTDELTHELVYQFEGVNDVILTFTGEEQKGSEPHVVV